MRWTTWRRALAVVALIVGIGVGASAVPASAATVGDGGGVSQTSSNDIWW